jgi:hypothetical protein
MWYNTIRHMKGGDGVKANKIKHWFDNVGLISIIWITLSIFVFEVIFLTTALQRKDFFFTYVVITMSVPIIMYLIYQYRIRIIKKKNKLKLLRFFDVIKLDYQTKEFKNRFITPLSEVIPINNLSYDQKASTITIEVGVIEKLKIGFDETKAQISINEAPIHISYYYKRIKKSNDWNGYSNYRFNGSRKLYEHLIEKLTQMIHYGCIIEEYHIDSKDYRIIAYINDVVKTKLFDSISPFDKKASRHLWFKSKPKSYRITFK